MVAQLAQTAYTLNVAPVFPETIVLTHHPFPYGTLCVTTGGGLQVPSKMKAYPPLMRVVPVGHMTCPATPQPGLLIVFDSTTVTDVKPVGVGTGLAGLIGASPFDCPVGVEMARAFAGAVLGWVSLQAATVTRVARAGTRRRVRIAGSMNEKGEFDRTARVRRAVWRAGEQCRSTISCNSRVDHEAQVVVPEEPSH